MLTILGRTDSSNVQKVLWCCGEIGVPFTRRDVGGAFGGNRTPQYLALNPNGLVPTIDDDGFVLWESNAIVRYLAARYGRGTLHQDDARERASAERWMDWQQTTLATPMVVLWRSLVRNPELKTPAGEIDAARERSAAAFGILDRQLDQAPYIAGSRLTVGDIALGYAVDRWFRLPIERPDFPGVKAWHERLRARPAYLEHVAGR